MDIKLKLKVKDVEIELSQKEAKELCEALQALVGEPETVVREVIRDHNPGLPYWPWRTEYPRYTWDITTTGGYPDGPINIYTARISDDVTLFVT